MRWLACPRTSGLPASHVVYGRGSGQRPFRFFWQKNSMYRLKMSALRIANIAIRWCRWCAIPQLQVFRFLIWWRWAGQHRKNRPNSRTRDGGAEIVGLLKTGLPFMHQPLQLTRWQMPLKIKRLLPCSLLKCLWAGRSVCWRAGDYWR